MRNATSVFSRGAVLLLCLVVLAGGITALARTESGKKMLGMSPAVKISLTANVERDKKMQPVNEKVIVKPGEVIYWNLASVNEGNAAANGYKTAGKIPAGTVFVAGSAKGDADAHVSYSIDGGKSFSEKPMVDETQPDGTVKQVPAPVSAYTDVLFHWESALEAGQKLNAAYEVQVK